MTSMQIPSGKDIYIEAEGKKLAVVQSLSVASTRKVYPIEAFGSEVAAASLEGPQVHRLTLKKIVPVFTTATDMVDFYSLKQFTVVVVKPNGRTVYSGCEWESIEEQMHLKQPCIETITLIAQKRRVIV